MDKARREKLKQDCKDIPSGLNSSTTLELIADLEAAEDKLRIATEALERTGLCSSHRMIADIVKEALDKIGAGE